MDKAIQLLIQAQEMIKKKIDALEMANRILREALEEDKAPGLDTSILTPKEREIFELLGSELRIKEIARKLGRSRKTVEAHRENIRKKLKIKSAKELRRIASMTKTK